MAALLKLAAWWELRVSRARSPLEGEESCPNKEVGLSPPRLAERSVVPLNQLWSRLRPERRQQTLHLPANIVARHVEHEVPKCDFCDKEFQRVGEERSEQLHFKPMELFVVVTILCKYIATCDCSEKRSETVESPIRAVDRGVAGNSLVATFEDIVFEQASTKLERGDFLFTFTDGVTEAHRETENDLFGGKRLIALLERCRADNSRAICEEVRREILDFSGGQRHDDITLLVLERR